MEGTEHRERERAGLAEKMKGARRTGRRPLCRALRAVLPAYSRLTDSIGKFLQGLFWELSPGPLTPEARIMPLDQTASCEVLINGTPAHVRFSREVLRGSLALRA